MQNEHDSVETTEFIDRRWQFDERYHRIEGWCFRDRDEFSTARLIDDDGTEYDLVSRRSAARPDLDQHLGKESGSYGFTLCFERKSSAPPPERRPATDETAALHLELVFASGNTKRVPLRSVSSLPIDTLGLADEVAGLSDDVLSALLTHGASLHTPVKHAESYIDQTIRFENWLLVKGWTFDTELDTDSMRLSFVGDQIVVESIRSARHYRADIQSPMRSSVVGAQYGFVLLLELSRSLNTSGKLTCRVDRRDGPDRDGADTVVLVNDISVPNDSIEYRELLSGFIDLFASTDTLVGPSEDLKRMLEAVLALEDEIQYVRLNSYTPALDERGKTPVPVGQPDLSLVVNLIDKPDDSLYGLLSNSSIDHGGTLKLYVSCSRPQVTSSYLSNLEKLAYLFNIEIVPIVYASFVTQARVCRDIAALIDGGKVCFVQPYSAIDLSAVDLGTDAAVLPAVVCSRVGQPCWYGLGDEGGRVRLNRRAADFAQPRNLPSFFGSIFDVATVRSAAPTLYSLSVAEFVRAAKAHVPSDIDPDACPQYTSYEAYDYPEGLYRLFNDWHAFEELQLQAGSTEIAEISR